MTGPNPPSRKERAQVWVRRVFSGELLSTVIEIAGAGSITAGAGLIYPPAGFITGGVLAITGCFLWASAKANGGERG